MPAPPALGGVGGGILGLGSGNIMGGNNVPSLMSNLGGGAGLLNTGMNSAGGGANSLLSGGMSGGMSGGGIGLGNSLTDNNLLTSGFAGNSILGRLGGSSMAGLSEGRNDFELQTGAGMFNAGAGGVPGSTNLGTNNRYGMDRGIEYGHGASGLDRGTIGSFDRLDRGLNSGSDTFGRSDASNTTVFVKNVSSPVIFNPLVLRL